MAEKRKGRPLRPGSLIAVPTPGSPLLDPKYLESGFGWLEAQGFRVRLTEHANIGDERQGAADDDTRGKILLLEDIDEEPPRVGHSSCSLPSTPTSRARSR
jgi:muramoyltetrapeptide carboxypeptidase LdcA involved in peptidoglycan recycling